MKVGFLGMGVMGLPMAKNLVKKSGHEIVGFDVADKRLEEFAAAGGTAVKDADEIYKTCDIIMQILPTHAIIRDSVEKAIKFGKPGRIIVDLSSTAPHIIQEMYEDAKKAGMFLLDSPISGGNPMAIAGTLAIMTGGDKEAFEKVMDYIKAVRTMRTEMNVHPAKKTSMIIETADAAPFQKAQVYLAKFAFATDVTFTEKYEGSTDGMVQVSTHAARGFIPMMELIDRDKELARLNKEKAKAEKEMAMFANQLNNPKFVERAPAALVEDIRNKYAKSQDKLANIEQSIKALG